MTAMFLLMATSVQVAFDCADPPLMASFWATALGYKLEGPPAPTPSWEEWLQENQIPAEHRDDVSAISDPDGKGPRTYFQRVPEQKVVKNRVHLDLNVGGGADVPLIQRRTRVDNEAERLARPSCGPYRSTVSTGSLWPTRKATSSTFNDRATKRQPLGRHLGRAKTPGATGVFGTAGACDATGAFGATGER